MKKLFYLIFLICFFANAQEKEITLLDQTTSTPISNVHLYYKNAQQGTISNQEGRTKIMLQDATLSVQHINYTAQNIPKNDLLKLDTIWLMPITNTLTEVVIKNINLKAKLQTTLNNYTKLYVNYSTLREGTFKESFLFDDDIKRLFLTDINYWSKNAFYNYRKKPEDFFKLQLGQIHYNRKENLNLAEGEIKYPALITKTYIPFLYLNHSINTLLNSNLETTHCSVQNETQKTITILYDLDWTSLKNGISTKRAGQIVFEKEENAIIQLLDTIYYKNHIQKKTFSKTNKTGTKNYKNQINQYQFAKNSSNKWSPVYVNVELNSDLIYENITHKIQLTNTLVITKETKKKKIKKKKIINLDLPIHENLPSETLTNSNTILLTHKEQLFIEANK
ncbi:hypothetical protein [Flavicella marina]|uniref:hypothetical protein n=1 Tax=Flavicella marina TaxID=1475951 RepID=UPI0012654269|nr:hypothetical protein [Flavicella marina]